jgi:hypothetical protein
MYYNNVYQIRVLEHGNRHKNEQMFRHGSFMKTRAKGISTDGNFKRNEN